MLIIFYPSFDTKGACVADYSYGGTRAQELQKFIQSPECFVMLLSKQGAVGLDLSFVTHIFFLGKPMRSFSPKFFLKLCLTSLVASSMYLFSPFYFDPSLSNRLNIRQIIEIPSGCSCLQDGRTRPCLCGTTNCPKHN